MFKLGGGGGGVGPPQVGLNNSGVHPTSGAPQQPLKLRLKSASLGSGELKPSIPQVGSPTLVPLELLL